MANKMFTMDGHNDALYYARLSGGTTRFDQGWAGAQLSLPALRAGGVAACFFAIFGGEEEHEEHRPELAAVEVDEMMAGYLAWLGPSAAYKLILSLGDLTRIAADASAAAQPFGVLLHLEGARGVRDPDHLHRLNEQGLRSVGLTWNYPNAYATGARGDPEAGLTARGRELVRELEALNMVIDASHLNRRGLWDLLEIATRPVLVTHTACRTLYDHPRNLHDDQLKAVAASGGTIGIFAANMFLGPEGVPITLRTMVDHYQHLAEVVGVDHVALGTDLGGIGSGTPKGMASVADIPALLNALTDVGWSADDVAKLAGQNYLRVLDGLLK